MKSTYIILNFLLAIITIITRLQFLKSNSIFSFELILESAHLATMHLHAECLIAEELIHIIRVHTILRIYI